MLRVCCGLGWKKPDSTQENQQKNSPHQRPIVSENPWKGWHWTHRRLSQGCRLQSSEQLITVQNWKNHGTPSLGTNGPLSMSFGYVLRLLGEPRCTCWAQQGSWDGSHWSQILLPLTTAKPCCPLPWQNCLGTNIWSFQIKPAVLSVSIHSLTWRRCCCPGFWRDTGHWAASAAQALWSDPQSCRVSGNPDTSQRGGAADSACDRKVCPVLGETVLHKNLVFFST